MSDRALYFPYIEVPDSDRLNRVLLYWDELGTIVPKRLPLTERMRELIDCELIIRVAPEELWWKDPGFSVCMNELAHRIGETDWGEPATTTRLHVDKADGDFWAVLDRHELVAWGQSAWGGGPWVRVDQRIATLFMAALASELGALHGMQPVTDQDDYFRSLAAPGGRDEMAVRRDKSRAVIVSSVLPAPGAEATPLAISEFKQRYWDLLGRFRRRVEHAVIDCAQIDDEDLRIDKARLVAGDFVDEVDEITARMCERRWNVRPGSLAAVIAGAPAGLQFAGSGDPLDAVGAVAPAIADLLETRLTRGQGQLDTPMAYAALARSTF